MLTSASVVERHPYETYGPTSLVEGLFAQADKPIRLMATPTSEIRCDFCARDVFSIIGDCITITARHGDKYHRTVIPLAQLGLQRISD